MLQNCTELDKVSFIVITLLLKKLLYTNSTSVKDKILRAVYVYIACAKLCSV